MLKTSKCFRLADKSSAQRADCDYWCVAPDNIPAHLIYDEQVDTADNILTLSEYNDALKIYKSTRLAVVLLWVWCIIIGYAVSWAVIKVSWFFVIPYAVLLICISNYIFQIPDGVLCDTEGNIFLKDNGWIAWNGGARVVLRNSPH